MAKKKAKKKATKKTTTTKRKTAAKKSAKAAKTVKKASVKKTVSKSGKAAPAKAAKKSAKSSASYKIGVGSQAPTTLTLHATSGRTFSIGDLAGHTVVLYFYPRDNTPGCTLEGQDFKRLGDQFAKTGTQIFGVSQDSLKSHEGFKSKCGFPFELISDESGELCRAFDVIQMKNMYGREFEGIERSTFVIDASGKIRAEWRKLKVEGHAQEVLDAVKGLVG